MWISKFKHNIITILYFLVLIAASLYICSYQTISAHATNDDELKNFVENIFLIKSRCVLSGDLDSIESIYDTETKCGQWAYE